MWEYLKDNVNKMATASALNLPDACFDENRRADANWQVNKSLGQCNQHLFETKEAADIIFSIEYENGPSKSAPVKIPAHKLILLARSPVFHTMFCGKLPFTDPEITVKDVDPDAFKEVLRFMYYDKAAITPDNVLFVIYATKKYMIPALKSRCIQFLEKDLGPANVCLILEHSLFFGEGELIQKALEVIKMHTVEVLDSSAFTGLSSAALGKILDLEAMTAEEVDIFAACMEWVSAECERQELEDSPDNQRKVLGSHLYKIRFPAMTIQQFADIVVPTGILQDTEGFLIFQYFVCQTKPDVSPFQAGSRAKQQKPTGRLVFSPPYSSKSVTLNYQSTLDLYCLVSKEIKLRHLYLHDFVRKGPAFSKFEVRLIQEQEEKATYSNGDRDTEVVTIDGCTVSKIPMNNVCIKAGKFKVHIDHWILQPKLSSTLGQSDFTLRFSESEKAFVGTDKVLNMKIGSLKEMPLFGIDYVLA